MIVDRDSLRWFKPLKDQFHIFYKRGAAQSQYVPDVVDENMDLSFLVRAGLTV